MLERGRKRLAFEIKTTARPGTGTRACASSFAGTGMRDGFSSTWGPGLDPWPKRSSPSLDDAHRMGEARMGGRGGPRCAWLAAYLLTIHERRHPLVRKG